MNLDEQRIAIAEHLGWTQMNFTKLPSTLVPYQRVIVGQLIGCPPDKDGKPRKPFVFPENGPFNVCYYSTSFEEEEVPNYCFDLNAMRRVEDSLPTYNQLPLDKNIDRYHDWLVSVCGSINAAFGATAAQRAEAFLKTIGKWKNNVNDLNTNSAHSFTEGASFNK